MIEEREELVKELERKTAELMALRAEVTASEQEKRNAQEAERQTTISRLHIPVRDNQVASQPRLYRLASAKERCFEHPPSGVRCHHLLLTHSGLIQEIGFEVAPPIDGK